MKTQREYLFRGMRKHGNHEWLKGFIQFFDGAYFIFPEDETINSYDWYEVIPETIGQFVGQLDINGTTAFEGDKWRKGGYVGEIVFSQGQWAFIQLPESQWNETPHFYTNISKGAIVGNIYERKYQPSIPKAEVR